MRAVVVSPGPEFSVMDVYRGWVGGLRAQGVEVFEFNFHDRLAIHTEMQVERDVEMRHLFDFDAAVRIVFESLQATLYATWPDIIVVVSGHFFSAPLFDMIRANRPHKLVMLHTESPYEDERQIELAQHFDVNVLNDPINIDRFPAGTIYIPHAYDPAVHHANGRTEEFDFSFVGTGYRSRIDYFEKVDFGSARVALAGNWPTLDDDSPLMAHQVGERDECFDNADTADMYRRSAMSANLYRVEADSPDLVEGWAMGPREVELAACGTFFARDPRPEGDELLPMLPKVTCPAELTDVLRWSMAHPEQRQQAADAARAAVSDRTFSSNAARLLRALDA